MIRAYPNPMNLNKLREDLLTTGLRMSFRSENFEIHDATVQDEATIDSILQNHNAEILSESQQIESAQTVLISQAKDYFRKQLLIGNPNLGNIFTTVKAQVDGNAYLSQMVANQILLMRGAFGWAALDLGTAQGQQRYLLAVQHVIALLG